MLALLLKASLAVCMVSAAPIAQRALPPPVSVATAKQYLLELAVAVESNVPAYSRDQFKTWDISLYNPSPACNQSDYSPYLRCL